MKRLSFKSIFGLARQSASDWWGDRAPRLGAALAFYTTFSIAPLVLIAISMAGIWFGQQQAREQIIEQIAGMVGNQGAKAISDLLASAQRPGEGIMATVVAVFTLMIGAMGVFAQLQDALNTIWRVKPKPGRGLKGFIRHRLLSLAMVFGIGFLLLVSLLWSAGLAAAGKWLAGTLPGGEPLWQVINFTWSFLLVALLFALMFKYLPDVKIAWRDVWIGGALTAFLFTAGKFALGLYLGRTSVASAYGAAGSFVILLLWVYYSTQIFLFGAEFTRAYASRYDKKLQPAPDAMWAAGPKAETAGGV